MTEELNRLNREDTHPNGFTKVDNRDIWTSSDLRGSLIFNPVTLGIFLAMRSLPGDWVFHESWLIKHLRVGKQRLRRSLAELKEAGRLSQGSVRDESTGRYIGNEWKLYPGGLGCPPQDEKRQSGKKSRPSDKQKSARRKLGPPQVEKPASGGPSLGKQRLLSTEEELIIELPTTDEGSFVLPAMLDEEQKAAVVKVLLLSDSAAEVQQQLADELSHAMATREVANPVAYLRKLVERARQGEYFPDGALLVAKHRRNAEAAEQRNREEIEKVRRTEALIVAERDDPDKDRRVGIHMAQFKEAMRY